MRAAAGERKGRAIGETGRIPLSHSSVTMSRILDFSVATLRLRLIFGLAVLVVGATSCGVIRRSNRPALWEQRVPIEVVNQNEYEATVFTMVDGTRTRIGSVPGNTAYTLSTPFPSGGRMSVEVRLVPVGSYASWAFDVAPGRRVRVEIPSDLHRQRATFPR
jgi:hypothetical protein